MTDFELKFDPKTIEHLGVKMYSTLPPALAELISNAYDADASKIVINFHEQNKTPKSITIQDNGIGMSSQDIQDKFLVIGRNRRKDEGDKPSQKFKRLPTGKKGLGKLSLFGLAKEINVDTSQSGLRNRFTLNWENLLSARGVYNPKSDLRDADTPNTDGTIIKLSNLKRKSPFDLNALADSLSRIFIVDNEFEILLTNTNGTKIKVTNERRYNQIETQFEWDKDDLIDKTSKYYSIIDLKLFTGKTPIPPSSGLRGVTIFSRGKLVNLPEYFSPSTSSHFFQYLTGWIKADFIDLLDEDVISTNRQSINWEDQEMTEFREFLSSLIMKTNQSWREKRANEKEKEIKKSTGIDREKWLSTLPKDIQGSVNKIVDTMTRGEDVSASFAPVIKALHDIIPEYPLLHWRHLHERLRPRIENYYISKQFGLAADQGTKIYSEAIKTLTGVDLDGTKLSALFNFQKSNTTNTIEKLPHIQISKLETESERNIQEGQGHLTRGLMQGFRNPVNHAPIDSVVPETFSELDCLNILSLVSYLISRLDDASINEPISQKNP